MTEPGAAVSWLPRLFMIPSSRKEENMPVTVSKLRENIYRLIDQVIDTGIPLEIKRKGKILKIVPEDPKDKLDNLITRSEYLKCDPEDIIHLDWSGEWRP